MAAASKNRSRKQKQKQKSKVKTRRQRGGDWRSMLGLTSKAPPATPQKETS